MKVKIGSKINEGITAEIYEWENSEKIIKLAKTNRQRKAMLSEYLKSQFV